MALAATSSSMAAAKAVFMAPSSPCSPVCVKSHAVSNLNTKSHGLVSKKRCVGLVVRASSSAPTTQERMKGVVEESIKQAEETCAGDETSGECAAAWDEVEEVSAAASDIRSKEKSSDPLETFCNENPETDECRTYDN